MTAPVPRDEDDSATLPTGTFSSWMAGMQRALRGEAASDVPCGTCTACCTASQFIHVGPEETDALAHIPNELVFPAPGLPDGHVVMGYDEHGCCPMLIDGACSIYEHRPRTCRTYDCRIFPATGLDPGLDDKPLIAAQARRWRFTFPTEADREQRAAVQAAVIALRDEAGDVTRLAVAAIERHQAFLARP